MIDLLNLNYTYTRGDDCNYDVRDDSDSMCVISVASAGFGAVAVSVLAISSFCG